MLVNILILKMYKDTLHKHSFNMKIKGIFGISTKYPNGLVNFASIIKAIIMKNTFLNLSNFSYLHRMILYVHN